MTKLGLKSNALESFGHKLMGGVAKIGHKAMNVVHGVGNVGGALGSLAAPAAVLATALGQPEIGAGLMTAANVGGAMGATNSALKRLGI